MGHEEVQADVKNHEGHEEHEDFGTHIPAIVRGSFVKGPSSYKYFSSHFRICVSYLRSICVHLWLLQPEAKQ